jgi:N-ethylmaleimide reductase
MTPDLFAPFRLGGLELANRVVMAPMTRNRALGNLPNDLMATYYAQRAGAGLIITEGTTPSPDGLGYPRIPGIFSAEQVAGWRLVTEAVHARGAKIFLQMMHTGRIGHPANLPPGAEVLGPSAVAAAGEIWTDSQGMQPHPVPRAMTEADIEKAIAAFVLGATNAVAAGFDGIELHAANGYLLEQFLNPGSNQRTDAWGGDPARRARLVLEVAKATVAAIGAGRVGIRLSPHGVFNDIAPFDGIPGAYADLAGMLNDLGLVYLHVVDHSPMGAPPVPDATKAALRAAFKGTLILSGGYDRARAEADLAAGRGDLVAFGRPFIANPDLVARLKAGADLAAPDMATFYTPGAKGYTDYPTAG